MRTPRLKDRETRVLRRVWVVLLLGWLSITGSPLLSQTASVGVLPVLGTIAPDGSAVELSWQDADPPRAGNVVVMRRELGETGVDTWQTIAPQLGAVFRFRDTGTEAGIAYEYRVQRENLRDGRIADVGIWTTGIDVPAVERRGTALLVVDETIADALAPWLDRYEMDLLGDGWQVKRLSAPRAEPNDAIATLAAARGLKEQIKTLYWKDPFGGHALVLVGHVPLVRSGRAAPDGHKPISHGTDLFYADMEGDWPDDGKGRLLPNHVVGGKIAMPVGRIDFSNVKSAGPEIPLLRSYFDRNHAWRMGYIGDLRQAYGKTGHLVVERRALNNVVGPEAVTVGGHHDAGQIHPWLLGVDFGNFQGSAYARRYSSKAIFAINFGSHKQKIQNRNNAMNTLLAQPFYPLAVGWGGRPAWWLHPMSMGQSMGMSHMRTVNNGLPGEPYPETMEYLPTGRYVWRNPVWVNLLGDPTVRPFPLPPVNGLTAFKAGNSVRLSWTAPQRDVLGYAVYRAPSRTGPYQRLAPDSLIRTTSFTDPAPLPGGWYMLRVFAVQQVHAGSFRDLSQGRFASPGLSAPEAPDLSFYVPPGEATRVLSAYDSSLSECGFGTICPVLPDSVLRAPARGAANASLTRDGAGWWLEPRPGVGGNIQLPYFASNSAGSSLGAITINIDEP